MPLGPLQPPRSRRGAGNSRVPGARGARGFSPCRAGTGAFGRGSSSGAAALPPAAKTTPAGRGRAGPVRGSGREEERAAGGVRGRCPEGRLFAEKETTRRLLAFGCAHEGFAGGSGGAPSRRLREAEGSGVWSRRSLLSLGRAGSSLRCQGSAAAVDGAAGSGVPSTASEFPSGARGGGLEGTLGPERSALTRWLQQQQQPAGGQEPLSAEHSRCRSCVGSGGSSGCGPSRSAGSPAPVPRSCFPARGSAPGSGPLLLLDSSSVPASAALCSSAAFPAAAVAALSGVSRGLGTAGDG